MHPPPRLPRPGIQWRVTSVSARGALAPERCDLRFKSAGLRDPDHDSSGEPRAGPPAGSPARRHGCLPNSKSSYVRILERHSEVAKEPESGSFVSPIIPKYTKKKLRLRIPQASRPRPGRVAAPSALPRRVIMMLVHRRAVAGCGSLAVL